MIEIDDQSIHAICNSAFSGENWSVAQGKSGMNNTTKYIETLNGKYVLRIYKAHTDRKKVEFEHEILIKLINAEHPFTVPIPIEVEGSTVIQIKGSSLYWVGRA